MSAKSTKEAGRSLWLGSLTYIPLSAVFFLIGTALFVFYNQSTPQVAATTTPVISEAGAELAANQLPAEMNDADKVFPYFIQKRLPSGLSGLLVAAVFAAAMSTVSASLNSASTVSMRDFYLRIMRPDASDADTLRVMRRLTLIYGIVGTLAGLAVAILKMRAAIDIWWDIAGVLGGPFLGLFLMAVMVRRLRGIPILISAVAGAVVIAWIIVSARGWWPESVEWLAAMKCPWDGKLAGPAGTVTMVVIAAIFAGFRATEPKVLVAAPSELSAPSVPTMPDEAEASPGSRLDEE